MLSTSMSSRLAAAKWALRSGRMSGMFWTFMSMPLNSWSSSLVAAVAEADAADEGGVVEWTSALVSTMLGILAEVDDDDCCC